MHFGITGIKKEKRALGKGIKTVVRILILKGICKGDKGTCKGYDKKGERGKKSKLERYATRTFIQQSASRSPFFHIYYSPLSLFPLKSHFCVGSVIYNGIHTVYPRMSTYTEHDSIKNRNFYKIFY